MRKLLFLTLSVGLSFLLAESVLRKFAKVEFRSPPPRAEDSAWGVLSFQPSEVPGLAYELAPDRSRRWRRWTIATNSYGMRDREPLQDADNLVRIAVLGDSVTFGWGIEAHETYSDVLERMLNKSNGGDLEFDVLNFGVIGYSSQDEALVLKHKVLSWKPDLLVIGYVLNDPEIDPIQPLQAAFAPLHWWQHSHLLRLMAQARWQWDIRSEGGGDYHRYLHADGRRWGSVVEAFGEMGKMAKDLEIPVVLTIFPRIPGPKQTWDGYLYEDVHRQVAALGAASGFDVLDLLTDYKGQKPRDFGVSFLDRHPNWLGHYIAGQDLHVRVQEILSLPVVAETGEAAEELPTI